MLMDDIRVREPWLMHTRPTRFCGIAASAINALHYGQDKPDDLYWKAERHWSRARWMADALSLAATYVRAAPEWWFCRA